MMDTFNIEPPVVRNISNSEVTTFLSCKRQYEFAFVTDGGLEPINTSDPLARGTTFHLGMEKYWFYRLQGMLHEQAMELAAATAFSTVPEGFTLQQVMEAQFLWNRYMNFHNGWPHIKPLGTEQLITVPLTSTINFTLRYDFYFQNLQTGKFGILDYKTSFDFWSPEDHDLNGQMPKYVAALQANGMQVDEGFLEEIRTRKLGADKSREATNLWRTTRYCPSWNKKKSLLDQHIKASLEIIEYRDLPREERLAKAIPVLNKHGACKYCNFKSLCISMLDGKQDLTVDIRVGYKKNTYSYNEEANIPNVNF